MSKIEIEVTNDNAYNAGWLDYLLGLPQPDREDERAHGFTMAMKTPGLSPVRNVFFGRDENDVPVYRVTVVEEVIKAKAAARE